MDINDAGLFMRINVAAQRARQLMQGAVPKVRTQSRKPAAIAIQEVDSGQVEFFTPAELPDVPEEVLLEDEEEEEEQEL